MNDDIHVTDINSMAPEINSLTFGHSEFVTNHLRKKCT